MLGVCTLLLEGGLERKGRAGGEGGQVGRAEAGLILYWRGITRGHQEAMRTSLPPAKVSLTLWRKNQSGRDRRQGGQHGRMDPSRREKMVASAGERMEDGVGGGMRDLLGVQRMLSGSDLTLEGGREGDA